MDKVHILHHLLNKDIKDNGLMIKNMEEVHNLFKFYRNNLFTK
jgi:hypothetical protein